MSLVEVGLSSAQHGALEVESVRMFPCELARSLTFVHQSFCFVRFFFFHPPIISRAISYPCCKLCVCLSGSASEVNIAALGKQMKEEPGWRSRGAREKKKEKKRGTDNLRTDPSLYPIINALPRNTV